MRKEVYYRCQYCDKQFDDSDECMEHERTHIKDYADASNEEVKKELQRVADASYGWHVGGMICGMPIENFKSLISTAIKRIGGVE